MSFREVERKKAIRIREKLLRDPGDGYFFKKKREYVLKDAMLNLMSGVRYDVVDYFDRKSVTWWMGEGNNEPTGHLLSSQMACLNHLFFVRQRKDVATIILKNILPEIEEALIVDDGFVEFEVVGSKNYLGEKSHIRGANSTSIDAIMIGKKSNGDNILFLIEWKYTEEYRTENKYIPQRYNIYNKLLKENGCPIIISDFESLYYEPFYQLMRQTLLGWKMVQNHEYNCNEYLHLHVIPEQNKELRERVTSTLLTGNSMSEAWKSVLTQPERYVVIPPIEMIKPVENCVDTKSVLAYLQERYWD